MENDARSKVLLRLLEMANSKGYVTFDDIMSCSDESSLSIKDFDWVAESIVYRNVLVYDTPPVQQYPIDLTQYIPKPSTYDQVYKEIVALDPSLKQLIMDIRSIEPPRRGEITRLQAQIADGNQYARTRMIEMYMRVALKVALSRAKTYDLDLSDTIDRAFFALIKAVDNYGGDLSKGKYFSTYISNWIYWNMTRDLCVWNSFQDYSYRRINQAYLVYPILKKNGCFECESFHVCNTARLSIKEKLKCSNELCEEVITIILKPLSIEKIEKDYRRKLYKYEVEGVITEGPDYPFHLQYKADDWDENLDDKYRDEWVQTTIAKKMNKKEIRILEGRFGLNGCSQMTLGELGKEFDLTRERIRQIEAKSLRKLAYAFRRNKLSSYIQKNDQSTTPVSSTEPHNVVITREVPKETSKASVTTKRRSQLEESSEMTSQMESKTTRYQQSRSSTQLAAESRKKSYGKWGQGPLSKSNTRKAEGQSDQKKESKKKGKKYGHYTKWSR